MNATARITRAWFTVLAALLTVATGLSVGSGTRRGGWRFEIAAPAPELFRDGDVVCFLGDSITQAGHFASYLEAFHLTRFPERRIRFVNAGIAGSTAAGALRRLEWDVLPHQPTVVSLMFGMNDVQRSLYGETPEGAYPPIAERGKALAEYRANLTRLAQRLTAASRPRLIFATPSPYDESVISETPNRAGLNVALARCAVTVGQVARERGGSVVDFHTPMTALNLERQELNREFTLIGRDRIHPGLPGHLAMAFFYLEAQQAPAIVSEFQLDGATGRVVRAVNGAISNVDVTPAGIGFDCRERALPFPLLEDAEVARHWLPIETALNRQWLAVDFPRDGDYQLIIDGEPVEVFSAAQWREGVNLAANPRMPQWQQAQRVLAAVDRKRQQEGRVRSFMQVKAMLRDAKVDENDDAAVEEFFGRELERHRGRRDYFEKLFANYPKTKPLLAELEGEIETMRQELWRLNQPVTRRYVMLRKNPSGDEDEQTRVR